jgi:predicted phosphodiesterase
MIAALISDIHSNREALDAVLSEIEGMGVETIFCLGDIVGYNADPDGCTDVVMSRAAEVVRGNHDKAVAGLLDLDWFNSSARAAAQWTRSTIRPDTLETLRRLAQGPREAGDGEILLCHGTPYDEDAYLMDTNSIEASWRCLDSEHRGVRFCFFGHTHVPFVLVRRKGTARPQVVKWRETLELDPGAAYLINPGSVGQPRDGIALASFGILDTGRMIYRNVRARYAVLETQRKILQAGLPPGLAHRLAEGR